jgi:hypothetical protein
MLVGFYVLSNRWLWQAGKNGFDKSIEQSVERLLAPDNAKVPPGNQVFGFGQLGPALSSFSIAARMNALGLVNPRALTAPSIRSRFPTQSHGDSGSARCSRILSHNCSLHY